MATSTEIPTIRSVSQRNMPKIVPVSAPLHLCTPMDFARCESEEMDINAELKEAESKSIRPKRDTIYIIVRASLRRSSYHFNGVTDISIPLIPISP